MQHEILQNMPTRIVTTTRILSKATGGFKHFQKDVWINTKGTLWPLESDWERWIPTWEGKSKSLETSIFFFFLVSCHFCLWFPLLGFLAFGALSPYLTFDIFYETCYTWRDERLRLIDAAATMANHWQINGSWLVTDDCPLWMKHVFNYLSPKALVT